MPYPSDTDPLDHIDFDRMLSIRESGDKRQFTDVLRLEEIDLTERVRKPRKEKR